MTLGNENAYVLCEDLFKIYKIADLEVVALRGLDLDVRRGEVVAIVGASGSGKSTLLNILAGYDAPSAGRVTVGGKDLLQMSGKDVEDYRRNDVGFIWQQTSRNMFPYLTSIENVALPMMLTNKPGKERQQRAKELLEIVGLGHRLDHTPEKLSGGEQQRVAIAVALANDPPLLLADEPTGELDDTTAAEILDLFGSVNQELGTTILIVTHDPDIAYKVGRVVMIRDGKMSTEIRRRVSFQRITGDADAQASLEEFTLVDASGRVQIPRDLLDSLKIKDKARVTIENGTVTLRPEE
ncbi:MAG: ABC transporter ATP-binding protein [SAR202 cluster bacterium]|jgi:ABC-type lipoprotein export system ATPase subunit|nr:ABC transporter ATP-binding protein [SAR202 cluster bacterium]MDP6299869.1 ABC transporter ATP-binding protein [SAR202 cluster bacterium]MDP7102232.1 ABC transporter ATP-binding protein [SAR202 cluster bacterium]MDP7225019.1 ABC transporter ATP-binding protein [SAR202 cluster bacterium]MDP7414244.1 ABC transporter ATP-binding protein [SAR202 cluster bacterium]|tara:strand:- start:788 stop:1675 length:888 start_codon:yes stop_codon:yes gene_type:complete